jgi:very-short-patch-repair endonuclease
VADFAVHEHRLVIEVDGERHFTAERLERDRLRDDWLAIQGYRVLRINTGELSDSFNGCVEEILRELGLMAGHTANHIPAPSPQEAKGPGVRP